MNLRWIAAAALLVPGFVLARQSPSAPAPAPSATTSDQPPDEHLEVGPPPFSEGVYPCTFCHDDTLKPNPKRRAVEDHEDVVLKHFALQDRWCLDCHDTNNRDVLHLASGEPLPFDESYRLCGQCHGEKYRDWRVGVHGRRTGQWNGQKGYLLCVNCHSPHEPRFKSMPPKAAPHRPVRPK